MKKFRVLYILLVLLSLALLFSTCSSPSGGDGGYDPFAFTMIDVPLPPEAGFTVSTGVTTKITKSYKMMETEVTQGLWKAVMGNNPSTFTVNPEGGSADLLPVESMTWYAAIDFCNKLSTAMGKEPVYTFKGTPTYTAEGNIEDVTGVPIGQHPVIWNDTKNGYRLPTEMEWQWAAMGADTRANAWQKAYAGDTNLASNFDPATNGIGGYAWYASGTYTSIAYTGTADSKTHQAGWLVGNELNLKDMSGNVWEWCWDWYETDYAGAPSGPGRVMRGSGWVGNATYCAVAYRGRNDPDVRDNSIGFRVVCP